MLHTIGKIQDRYQLSCESVVSMSVHQVRPLPLPYQLAQAVEVLGVPLSSESILQG